MTASARHKMQDRAISQLLSGMKIPSFATAGSSGNKSITIENKINAPIMVTRFSIRSWFTKLLTRRLYESNCEYLRR